MSNIDASQSQNHEQLWSDGKDFESDFWARWIETRGGEWPEDFKHRCNPDSTLHHCLVKCANAIPGQVIRILDVGAGPLTLVGKTYPGKRIEITAVDPLADRYDTLLKRFGIAPLVRTIRGEAERLTELFAPNSFDIAHAQNSIDHSYDAIAAIEQMFEITAPGGFVVLNHFENEALAADWGAFHQWNFCLRDGAFTVWDRTTTINITERFRARAKVEPTQEGKVVRVTMQKHK